MGRLEANHRRRDSWTPKDKETVLASARMLVEKGIVSDVLPVDEALVEGEGLRAIRLAAARAGADAVLVVDGVADVDRHFNGWAALYALLVTVWFVPGSDVDVLHLTHAALWDVRNEYLYLSLETEGTQSTWGSVALVDEDGAVAAARAKALAMLGKEVADRVLAMSTRPRSP